MAEDALNLFLTEAARSRLRLEQLRQAIDAHAIVSITDLDGKITEVNEKFCLVSGYSRDELIGQSHCIVKSGEHSPQFYEALWQTISSGNTWHGEICNRRKTGELYWLQASIIPIMGVDGLPREYISIRTDITSRMKAAALERDLTVVATQVSGATSEELDRAISHSLELIGRRLEVSRAYLFQFSDDKRTESNTHEWCAAGIDSMRERLQAVPLDGMPWWSTNLLGGRAICISRLDELPTEAALERRLIELQQIQSIYVQPIFGDGSCLGYVGFDIVDREHVWTAIESTCLIVLANIFSSSLMRQQALAALMAARTTAEQASRAKSAFISNMSHEIRTPMNGMIGMTELALESKDPDERTRYLQVIKHTTEVLSSIINDILDFSKIEAGNMPVDRRGFSVREELEKNLAAARPRAATKGLSIDLAIDSQTPHLVIGDPKHIRQIVFNLISNSIKFTEAGSIAVTVGVIEIDGSRCVLRFAVKDTGIGIAKDQLKQIFELFSQVDATTTRKYGGNGLGLTICSRLAQLMGGHIGVDSDIGTGSTFYFAVPFDLHLTKEEATAARPFDYAVGLRLSDAEVVRIIAPEFLNCYSDVLASLLDAITNNEDERLVRVALSLKGTLSEFGAQPARDLAEKIESKASEGQIDSLSLLHSELSKEVDALITVLRDFNEH